MQYESDTICLQNSVTASDVRRVRRELGHFTAAFYFVDVSGVLALECGSHRGWLVSPAKPTVGAG